MYALIIMQQNWIHIFLTDVKLEYYFLVKLNSLKIAHEIGSNKGNAKHEEK